MILAKELSRGAVVEIDGAPCLVERIAVQTPSARGANTLYKIRARMDRTTPEKQAIAYAKAWRNSAKRGEWIEVVVKKKWVWKQK